MTFQLLTSMVYHKRILPKPHSLRHTIFYYMFELNDLPCLNDYALSGYNRFHVWSLYSRDYGFDGDGLRMQRFVDIKSAYTIPEGKIYCMTVPKFMGHGFNPVSFFMFYDTQNQLRAVLSEVHNTFGERHCYMCRHPNGNVIEATDILRAEKIFHVSPFFPVSGHYLFQFNNTDVNLSIKIDYYNEQNQKTLVTGIKARKHILTKNYPVILMLQYPFISIKILLLIHYHAVILWLKKIPFYPKPRPPSQSISS